MRILSGCARIALTFAASGWVVAHGASPTEDDLARCASIATDNARLACYDSLAHRTADGSAAPIGVNVSSTSTVTSAASGPEAASLPHPLPEDPRNFGLSGVQQHVEKTQIKSQEASIVSIAHSVLGQASMVLDNGQSWKVLDDDGSISKGDMVIIKRASMGSFLMHTPSHHTFRVSRVR